MPTIDEHTKSVEEFLKKDPENAYNYREIADRLKISIGTVKSAIKRLLKEKKIIRKTAKNPVEYDDHTTIQRVAYFLWCGND